MVESLKELNKIVQKPHYKEVGNWMERNILRDAALPLTWLLLHSPISANQVTSIALLVGLFGAFLLSGSSAIHFLTATLLLQFWYYLDQVDGQIARYRKTASLSGRFFDFVMHHLINVSIFFPLGWHLWQQSGQEAYVLFGFILSVLNLFFNLVPDITYKTFFEKVIQCQEVQCKKREEHSMVKEVKKPMSLPKSMFSFLHKTCEIHVLLNTLTVAALLNMFWFEYFPFRKILFLFFGIILLIISPVRITYSIFTKKPDHEFRNYFTS